MPQVRSREVRPERIEEHHLGIRALPEQEVARALLPRRTHEEVDIRHLGRVEVAPDRLLADTRRAEPTGRDLRSDVSHRIRQLVAAAIVDAHRQREGAVARCQAFRELQLLDDGCPQPRAAPCPPHAHAPLVELIPAAVEHLAVEAHEEAHLVGRTLPVLGREGINAEVLDTDLDRPCDDVEEGGFASPVTLDPGQAARVRPAAVAVHDNGDMLWNGTPRQCRRRQAGPVERLEVDRVGMGLAHGTHGADSSFCAARALRSTCSRERSLRSMWNCAWAATTPLACERVRSSASSATAQSPDRSALSSRRVAASSLGAPGGATSSLTTPPNCTTNAE